MFYLNTSIQQFSFPDLVEKTLSVVKVTEMYFDVSPEIILVQLDFLE